MATTTGLPSRRAARVISFCRPGTVSIGNSTPKSPRATIRASDKSRMSGNDSSAFGFSILARMAARPPASLRSSATSSGRCTKDSATQSTPRSSAAWRSRLSLSVMAESGSRVSGRFTPLRLVSSPPSSTTASALSGFEAQVRSRTRPSSINRQCRSFRAANTSACGMGSTAGSVEEPSRASRIRSPSLRRILPPGSSPSRIFGPCKSTRIPMGRSSSFSSARTRACTAFSEFGRVVAHVDAENVCARLKQRPQLLGRGGSRPERRHNFRLAPAPHAVANQ